MNFRANSMRSVFVCALLLTLATVVDAKSNKSLYRYRNAEGNVVVGYQVPVELVGGGYEVLNDKGMVVRVVPRELTAQERKDKDAQEKLERAAREEEERLRKWDESLLLQYSTVADIEDAERRALGDLQIRTSILRGNRRAIKQKIENYQSQAADTERAGKSVDVERLRAIESLQNEIVAIERDIAERDEEIEALSASFQADIERFGMLQDVVKLRQTMRPRSSEKPAP